MSSFFRNPNDVTESEDQTYDDEESTTSESEDEVSEDAASPVKTPKPKSRALRKVETLDSTTSSTNAGALSRQLTADDGVKAETKEWLMRALLEDKCLNDALADFEARNTSGKPYTKDHPDVRALADAKYEHMIDMLGRANILPTGPERRNSASRAIKQQAKDGLEYLANTSPQPGRPGVMHRDSSLLSMHTGLRDLIVAQASNRAIESAPLYQQAALNHSMEAVMGLPPLLRPLVDHPMFELSRYLRDFTEISMIGKGGYGKVYHVQHRLDGSNYAVKKINLNQHRLRRIQERGQVELDGLLNELRMLARFDHPNIVRYYGGWLEYSTNTPFPSPAPGGKLMIEAPQDSHDDAGAGASRVDLSPGFIDFADSSSRPTLEGKRSSVDILFERSSGGGGEILGDLDDMDEQDDLVAELQPQIRAVRKRAGSTSTTASGKSKLSSVHSVGPEDETDELADGVGALQLMRTTNSNSMSETGPSSTDDIPHQGHHQHRAGHRPEPDSVLTLHIQMALHPLSLADYLTTSSFPSTTTNPQEARHCFHIRPSLQILLSILDGVQYLHDCGVVHRDLKPSNVFLTINTGRTPACIDLSKCSDCDKVEKRKGYLGTRIGDFGLVTEIARATSTSTSTSTDEAVAQVQTPAKAVGTELYRPPSTSSMGMQSRTSEKLDVYALGIILTELLLSFGTRMERQRTLQDVRMGRMGDVETLLVLRYGEDIGRKIGKLVGSMTEVEEGRRVGCEEVRDVVEDILGRVG